QQGMAVERRRDERLGALGMRIEQRRRSAGADIGQRNLANFHQRLNSAAALLALGGDLGAGALDLGLELDDVALELGDRHGRQILLLRALVARQQILLVHGYLLAPSDSCQCGAIRLEVQSTTSPEE